MIRAFLAAFLWVFLAGSCLARGYWDHGPDRELAEVQKMKGVEVQINEVQGTGGLIRNLPYGPQIPVTPVVEFSLKFLPENDFEEQGPIKEFKERIRRSGGEGAVLSGLEPHLSAVVLCIRDKDGRTLAVTPLTIQEDRSGVEEGKQGVNSVHFAIAKDLLEHSLLRFVEFAGHARQATDLYLGQKPKPGALRYWVDPETDPAVKTPTEAEQSASPLPLIPGLLPFRPGK